jgi:ATP-dependent phosphoenolpyruvate carboxykinase
MFCPLQSGALTTSTTNLGVNPPLSSVTQHTTHYKFLMCYSWRLRMSLITKKKFKTAVKQFLYTYYFYTVEEYVHQS